MVCRGRLCVVTRGPAPCNGVLFVLFAPACARPLLGVCAPAARGVRARCSESQRAPYRMNAQCLCTNP